MRKKAIKALASKVNEETANEGESGWTVKAYGKGSGASPQDAYMVALPKEEVEAPIKAPISHGDISSYQRRFKPLLKQPNMFHGGWVPKGDVGSMDVSTAFPTTKEGFIGAIVSGVKNKQRAIGKVSGGEYAGDIKIPEHLSSQFGPDVTVTQTPNAVHITASQEEVANEYANQLWNQGKA